MTYIPLLALAVYAFALLSIELTHDWHRMHEDNGAMHTTFALSHIKLGLKKTRAHDLFFKPDTGRGRNPGHHPPATALLVALAFTLTGSAAPWAARLVPIAFHMGSLFLLVALFNHFFDRRMAVFGGFLLATIPMSSYFGRMVNYEPLCLFAVLIQLSGYAACKGNRRRFGLAAVAIGVVLGGLIDWAALFFAAAIACVEAWDLLRGHSRSKALLVTLIVSALGIFAFDLGHLWYAGGGSLGKLGRVIYSQIGEERPAVATFLRMQIESYRLYYTHVGFMSTLLIIFSLIRPRASLARELFKGSDRQLLQRLLVVTFVAPLAYVLAAPWWACTHAYWQFYFLPFVGLSMLLVAQLLWRRLRDRGTPGLRILVAVCALEMIATTVFMLHLRYTKPGEYAIEQTARYREKFLTAESSVEKMGKNRTKPLKYHEKHPK